MTLPPAADLTRRESLALRVSEPVCSTCHRMMDPLGASLEHFGLEGEIRALDQGRPIDSSGEYLLAVSGRLIEFDDHVSLGKQLVDTCGAHLGVAARFVRLAQAVTGRSPEEDELYYQASVERVQQGFIRGGRTYRALLDAYLQSPAVLRP